MVGIPELSGPLKQFKIGRQQWQGTLIFKYLCGLVQPPERQCTDGGSCPSSPQRKSPPQVGIWMDGLFRYGVINVTFLGLFPAWRDCTGNWWEVEHQRADLFQSQG